MTWRLHVWGIFLDGQGYQESHIHPTARLSGVYYVQVPSIVGAGGDDHAGWIRSGRPSRRYQGSVEPPTLDVKPEEGLMLLFPSSYWHETIPFASDETRISIAFDVID